MQIVSSAPFQSTAFRQLGQDGRLSCVVVLKATFMHRQGQYPLVASEQVPLVDADVYEGGGDPQHVPLTTSTDFVPSKPGTDVVFLGKSHSPDGTACAQWQASLEVGSLKKTILVHGRRNWITERKAGLSRLLRKSQSWQIAPQRDVDSVTIDWRNTVGGWSGQDQTGQFNAFNPIGRTASPPDDLDEVRELPAITTEDGQLDSPAGFGPLAPFYKGRQQYAGTYDDAWLTDRHPLLPQDFQSSFWNVAPADQIVTPHLQPNQPYKLHNLSPVHGEAKGMLPNWQPTIEVTQAGSSQPPELHFAELNDVIFDWREDTSIILIWRAQFSLEDAALTEIHIDAGMSGQKYERFHA